ncbi:hypothetical protein ACIOD2_44185 [Amycolatopsis sp. NPDC088138]|uniref:hypothetical protein n=1 Tax=Amycolatopsis sp. NPDC088138 TaxID=3363938 RepID=UPI0038173860
MYNSSGVTHGSAGVLPGAVTGAASAAHTPIATAGAEMTTVAEATKDGRRLGTAVEFMSRVSWRRW